MAQIAQTRLDAGIRRLPFAPDGAVPNNPDLPALVMDGAISMPGDAEAVRALFQGNGWGGSWIWTVFDYHHFHPDAHEALACLSGWADLVLGGPSQPPTTGRPGGHADGR